jgi:cation-transporting ATPase E
LALEPNNERIEGSFIKAVLKASLPNGIALLLPVLSVVVLKAFGVFAPELGNTLAMVAVLSAGIVNLWVLAFPYSKWRLMVCSAMTGATVLAIPLSILIGDIFEFRYAAGHIGLAIMVALLSAAVAGIAHVGKFFIIRKIKKAKG